MKFINEKLFGLWPCLFTVGCSSFVPSDFALECGKLAFFSIQVYNLFRLKKYILMDNRQFLS